MRTSKLVTTHTHHAHNHHSPEITRNRNYELPAQHMTVIVVPISKHSNRSTPLSRVTASWVLPWKRTPPLSWTSIDYTSHFLTELWPPSSTGTLSLTWTFFHLNASIRMLTTHASSKHMNIDDTTQYPIQAFMYPRKHGPEKNTWLRSGHHTLSYRHSSSIPHGHQLCSPARHSCRMIHQRIYVENMQSSTTSIDPQSGSYAR